MRYLQFTDNNKKMLRERRYPAKQDVGCRCARHSDKSIALFLDHFRARSVSLGFLYFLGVKKKKKKKKLLPSAGFHNTGGREVTSGKYNYFIPYNKGSI